MSTNTALTGTFRALVALATVCALGIGTNNDALAQTEAKGAQEGAVVDMAQQVDKVVLTAVTPTGGIAISHLSFSNPITLGICKKIAEDSSTISGYASVSCLNIGKYKGGFAVHNGGKREVTFPAIR